MCLLSFLLNGKHKPEILYFNHNTQFGEVSEKFLIGFCKENNLILHLDKLKGKKSKGQSQEEFWRNKRYEFLNQFTDGKIATAHHLNDVAETYLFYTSRGNPKIIPPVNGNFIRPLILCSRKEIDDWNNRYKVPYLKDPSNNDTKYSRNKIRHDILPEILKVSPGFLTTMKKKVQEQL